MNAYHRTENRSRYYAITSLLCLTGFITYFFHAWLSVGTVFTHFYYIPIILASSWWGQKGIGVALLLVGLLMGSHFLFAENVSIVTDVSRAVMFLVVSVFVSSLNGMIRRSEQEIQAKEKKYRTLIENMADGVTVFVPIADGADFKIASINKAGQKIHGLHDRSVSGKTLTAAFPKMVENGALENLKRIWRSGQPESFHFSFYKNEKISGWLNNYVYKLDCGEIVWIYRDETERTKLERQLRQAQKMEAIGTLAGGIAHDFNNILVPIIGYTEMALDDLPTDSLTYRNLGKILQSATRARELTHQILEFSRQTERELKPVKLQAVLDDSLQLLRASIPSTIEIRRDIDANCGPILADSTQIHQIIMNLCTNAYHAMQYTGGLLEVRLHEVTVTGDDLPGNDLETGRYLCLEVLDTGEGMDAAVQEHIFDPYYTTKGKSKGTGLGLSVVHGIVNGYGGAVKVYSEKNRGTVFKVYFPITDAPSEKPLLDRAVELPHGSERILLIDDEEEILHMEKQMLERLGYTVTTFATSLDALAYFKDRPDDFDLVITDFTMPHLTGMDVTRQMVHLRPDLPVIICTGFSEGLDEKRAAASGARKLVMKPMLKYDIATMIREVLIH